MKKLNKLIWLGILLLPSLVWANLDEGISMVADTGALFGTIIVVIAVSLWMLPIAFAVLVYTGQKKKAEQMHEEVGLKAAVMALLAGVLGAAMAFYIVGTIGKYSMSTSSTLPETLKGGNAYLLQAVIGKGRDRLMDKNGSR